MSYAFREGFLLLSGIVNQHPQAAVTKLRADGEHASLALGTMNFGKRTSAAESKAIVRRALDLGIVHLDTANAYGDGLSETLVGEALGGDREGISVATKCGFGRVNGKPEGLSRARIREAIEGSLRRLGTRYIDVYYLHVPDHDTPIDESLDALAELLEEKKILAWGVSNYGAWQILEMIHKAEARAMPRPVMAQQLYNVLLRQLDVEYFPFARQYGLHTTVYNPLAGGLLTGKHTRDGSTQRGSRFDKNRLYQGRYFTDGMFSRTEAVLEVARAQSMSLIELAYAWLSTAPGVDSVLLGPASVKQLEESVAACALALSPEARRGVDALYKEWLGTDTYYVR